jgi:ParB family transcriptional regulator, chromosome partitioning protein
MSAQSDSTPAALPTLRELPVSAIDRNPANPRLHFPVEQLDRLAESIEREGILVPLLVYPDGDIFRLIDGERRWLVAQRLGLDRLPAVVTAKPDSRENLVQMFNVHMVREPWQDMPTAWALQKLIEETGIENDRELSDLCGLHVERIQRLRHAIELPTEYQQYIDEGRIPLNFFWELKKSVIDPLARRRPELTAEFPGNAVLDSFVAKRLGGVLTDTVSLRKVSQIVRIAEVEAGSPEAPSPLDDTLRQLISDPEFSVDQAYEDTVEIIVEFDKLDRRAANLIKAFERLVEKARSDEEHEHIKRTAESLRSTLADLLKL